MKVSEVAATLGVTPDTVRYYTRIRFVVPGKNGSNGYKSYSEADVQKLHFILSA